MTGSRRPNPARTIALFLTLGLVGCQTLHPTMQAELEPGHGRVDRTFNESLTHCVRATIEALDDLKVHPKDGSVRAIEAVSKIVKPAWSSITNDEYFPDDQNYHDLFDKHKMSVPNSDPIPFNPVLMTYLGETHDGRTISVVIRSQPPDAMQTMIMTRVGHNGDEAWSQKLLDKVADHLNALPKPPLPTLPTAAN